MSTGSAGGRGGGGAPDYGVVEDPHMRELARRGKLVRFKRNTVIISEGDEADTVFILLAGRVKIFSCNLAGHEIVIDVYGPGQHLGEFALDSGQRSASVMTLSDCVFSQVSRSVLQAAIFEHPEIALYLIRALITRVRAATDNMKRLALMPVSGRVVDLLWMHSVVEGGVRRVPAEFTQQEIADRIGASRDMVGKIIKQLDERGCIRREGRRTVLLRRPQLPD
jgi:CRP/FNR family transcriptional regulator, cyclic AMP receptor protein